MGEGVMMMMMMMMFSWKHKFKTGSQLVHSMRKCLATFDNFIQLFM